MVVDKIFWQRETVRQELKANRRNDFESSGVNYGLDLGHHRENSYSYIVKSKSCKIEI